ncbi:hypothetical protein DEJ13_01640 [Curtobacterium sp. MCLR17_007]|uniref:hypothetical protein n=1 Tax=Curtobacterium sp. MCLR17_007 TaxID=2175648 RepID=UPI0011B7AA4D|nr:hypothetical protein [Curtobacterium sp. MCLR17_007]WIB60556.1 hypothetical protein DEJ13_01640 [Curtobacterium sp. MCLR17_007]
MADFQHSPEFANYLFQNAGESFVDTLRAIHETFEELQAPAAELDGMVRAMDRTRVTLGRMTQQDLRIVGDSIRGAFQEGADSATYKDLLDGLWSNIKDFEWGPEFYMEFRRGLRRPRRLPIFLESILIRSVSELDDHFVSLARIYFRLQPRALAARANEVSLQELLDTNNLDETLENALETELDKRARGGLTGWRAFFEEALGIKFSGVYSDYSQIVEIAERRHCIVHHGGRASKQYVERSGTDMAKGTYLDASPDYVGSSIEHIETFGLLLTDAVWKKLIKHRASRDFFNETTAFAALKEKRWTFAEIAYRRREADPEDMTAATNARVNIWLAMSERDGLEAVRQDVEAWDISVLSDVYGFAKQCLLRDSDGAFARLDSLIETEALSAEALATWPITARLREDERIRKFQSLIGNYMKQESKQAIEKDELDAAGHSPA